MSPFKITKQITKHILTFFSILESRNCIISQLGEEAKVSFKQVLVKKTAKLRSEQPI